MGRQKNRANWGANIETPYMQRIKREAAQAAFVRQWRAEHPDFALTEGWRCPLCNEVCQVSISEAPDWQQHEIDVHQKEHGQDWTAYQAAGQPDRPTRE